MPPLFWIRRFITVTGIAFLIIAGAQLFKGHDLNYALVQGSVWSVITASVFTATRIYQSRKGQHCALCQDTADLASPSSQGRPRP